MLVVFVCFKMTMRRKCDIFIVFLLIVINIPVTQWTEDIPENASNHCENHQSTLHIHFYLYVY